MSCLQPSIVAEAPNLVYGISIILYSLPSNEPGRPTGRSFVPVVGIILIHS